MIRSEASSLESSLVSQAGHDLRADSDVSRRRCGGSGFVAEELPEASKPRSLEIGC